MRLFISFFLLCGFCSVCASDKAEIDTLHQRAYQLLSSHPDSAFALGAKAEAKAARAGLDLEEARSLFIQAYVYRKKKELGKAFILYLKALELLRPLEEENAKLTYSRILLNTGAILEYHYAYPQAVQYYDEAISVAQEHQFIEELLRLYNNKSEALRQFEKYTEALETVKSALELAQNRMNEERILTFLNQQGLILKDMGRYEEARNSYRQIIDFECKQIAPEKYRGRAWHNIGVTYVEEKRYHEAAEAYHHALAQKNKGNEKRLFITWLDLGEVYYLMGNYKAAYEMEQKAMALYDDILLQPDHYAIFNLLSKITYELGQYEQSYAYNEQFIAVNRRFLKGQKEILQVKDQYKMEILTAGFFLELEASRTKEQYQNLLILFGVGFTLISLLFGYEKLKQKRIRRSLRSAILDIERESVM